MADTLNLFFFISQMLFALSLPLIIAVVAVFIVSNIFKKAKQRTDNTKSLAAETGLTYVGVDSFQSIPGYQCFRLFNLKVGAFVACFRFTIKGANRNLKILEGY